MRKLAILGIAIFGLSACSLFAEKPTETEEYVSSFIGDDDEEVKTPSFLALLGDDDEDKEAVS